MYVCRIQRAIHFMHTDTFFFFSLSLSYSILSIYRFHLTSSNSLPENHTFASLQSILVTNTNKQYRHHRHHHQQQQSNQWKNVKKRIKKMSYVQFTKQTQNYYFDAKILEFYFRNISVDVLSHLQV